MLIVWSNKRHEGPIEYIYIFFLMKEKEIVSDSIWRSSLLIILFILEHSLNVLVIVRSIHSSSFLYLCITKDSFSWLMTRNFFLNICIMMIDLYRLNQEHSSWTKIDYMFRIRPISLKIISIISEFDIFIEKVSRWEYNDLLKWLKVILDFFVSYIWN
jgi:hypothetical protein